MTRIGPLHERLPDRWKYALIGGLLSIPFTTASYVESGTTWSLTPILGAGIVAGYLAKQQLGTVGNVGVRAGLIGGLPLLWMLVELLGAASALGGPLWFQAAAIVMTVGFVTTLAVGLSVLVGAVGARIGGWLATRTGRPKQPAVNG